MSSWMPDLPPQLLQQALARQAPPAPGVPQQPLPPAPSMPIEQPGMRQAIGPPSPAPTVPPQGGQPMGANRVPRVPYAPVIVPPVQEGQAPPPASDDKAVSPQQPIDPALRLAMESRNQSQAYYGQAQDAMNKWEGSKPAQPNYENYKPPLWKKIAAPFVGALAAQGHGDAGAAVGSMLYGPWNRAQQTYGQQEKQWEEQGQGIGRRVSLAEAQSRTAQENFTNQLNVKKEAETEKRDSSNAQYKSDLNGTSSVFVASL